MVAAVAAAAAIAVTGTAQQGQRLTAAAAAGSTYQWYRCAADVSHCSSVHGAKAASYTLARKDVGKTLALTVEAADGTASYAPAVGPVAAKAAALAGTARPAITGEAAVGKPLTVSNGTWDGATTGFAYAWLRCNANGRICIAIANATSASYTPVAADVGRELAVRVTASAAETAMSTLSTTAAPVEGSTGPVASVQPSVSGAAQPGKRLVVSSGTWTGNGTVKLAYQWYRCDVLVSHCSSVHGAKGAGYKLTAKDAGKTLTVTLKATDMDATVTVYLSAVGPVGATAPTVQPTVAGTTTLTVGPAGTAYTWLRCNANGRLCAPIAGATSRTYAPAAADEGHALVATVDGALSTRATATG